eukprot:1189629-Prorocentrum_minimum.AAC.4
MAGQAGAVCTLQHGLAGGEGRLSASPPGRPRWRQFTAPPCRQTAETGPGQTCGVGAEPSALSAPYNTGCTAQTTQTVLHPPCMSAEDQFQRFCEEEL